MTAQKEVKYLLEMARTYETRAAREALMAITRAEDIHSAQNLARAALGWPEVVLSPEDYRLPYKVAEAPDWVVELFKIDHSPSLDPVDLGWEDQCRGNGWSRGRTTIIGCERSPSPSLDGG